MIERAASAFKTEFYESSKRNQIKDDLVSYLGEYRFQVSEFPYEISLNDGKLTDPTTGELMTTKAKKAIFDRNIDGLDTSREEAELIGLSKLETKINKKGTITWFSPQGPKELGYGDYGFAYVGHVEENTLKMSAIRLESPSMEDFSKASFALWGEKYERAEEYLSSPQIVDVDEEEVKQFISGSFNIRKNSEVFKKSIRSMENVINDAIEVLQLGTEEEKHTAIHVVENLSLEMKALYENAEGLDFIPVNFRSALKDKKYTLPPPGVLGSCGASNSTQTNDIFRGLNYGKKSFGSSRKARTFEFNESGPCRMCGRDVNVGPCKVCEWCNDRIDGNEISA